RPGTWSLDTKTGEVTLWPEDGVDLARSVITAPILLLITYQWAGLNVSEQYLQQEYGFVWAGHSVNNLFVRISRHVDRGVTRDELNDYIGRELKDIRQGAPLSQIGRFLRVATRPGSSGLRAARPMAHRIRQRICESLPGLLPQSPGRALRSPKESMQ